MDRWFDITELGCGVFAISEPRHWERTNSYLFTGATADLLVDTGLGIGDIAAEVRKLSSRPVLALATHVHWDHIGGFASFGQRLVHPLDAGWLEHGLPLPEKAVKEALLRGLEPQDLPRGFSPDGYRVFTGKPSRLVRDGDIIDLGSRALRVIHTPGHSPGHVAVYEESSGFLATGDVFYEGQLYAFYPGTDPVSLARSLQKLAALASRRILPGHNGLAVTAGLLEECAAKAGKLLDGGRLFHGSGVHGLAGGVTLKT